MKKVFTFQVFLIAFLSTFYQEEVLGQSLYPPYGSAPVVYDSSQDDDLGLLLTVLLLATRNRNCNCCNCCNCGNTAKSIPIPYPIPFPTNNPIINRAPACQNGYYDDIGEENTDNGKGLDGGNSGVNTNYGDYDNRDSYSSVQSKLGEKIDRKITYKLVPTPIESDDNNNNN